MTLVSVGLSTGYIIVLCEQIVLDSSVGSPTYNMYIPVTTDGHVAYFFPGKYNISGENMSATKYQSGGVSYNPKSGKRKKVCKISDSYMYSSGTDTATKTAGDYLFFFENAMKAGGPTLYMFYYNRTTGTPEYLKLDNNATVTTQYYYFKGILKNYDLDNEVADIWILNATLEKCTT